MPPDESRRYKNAIYEQFARVGKAMCNAKRLELLDLLLQTERSVEVLAEQSGSSVANVSQHLQILKRSRLVESERCGNRVVYRIADPAVGQMLRYPHKLADWIAILLESSTPVNFVPGANGRPMNHRRTGLLNPDQVIVPSPHETIILGPGPQVEKTVIRSHLGTSCQPGGIVTLSFQLDGFKSNGHFFDFIPPKLGF